MLRLQRACGRWQWQCLTMVMPRHLCLALLDIHLMAMLQLRCHPNVTHLIITFRHPWFPRLAMWPWNPLLPTAFQPQGILPPLRV